MRIHISLHRHMKLLPNGLASGRTVKKYRAYLGSLLGCCKPVIIAFWVCCCLLHHRVQKLRHRTIAPSCIVLKMFSLEGANCSQIHTPTTFSGEREIKVVSDIGAGQEGNLKTKHSERTYVLSERTDAYPLTNWLYFHLILPLPET